jgi:hypothetical protein
MAFYFSSRFYQPFHPFHDVFGMIMSSGKDCNLSGLDQFAMSERHIAVMGDE